jgi:uncharacterized protein (TIGR03437 family)
MPGPSRFAPEQTGVVRRRAGRRVYSREHTARHAAAPKSAMRRPAKPLFLMLLACLPSHAQVDILTADGGLERTNANLQETQLSPATVSPSTFGKLGVFPVDGQVYSQPLYVSQLSIPALGTHNVLFVSTMHNSVYAFDADAPSPAGPLWQVNLGPSVPAALLYGPYGDIDPEVGILSAGAIDLGRGVLYVVSDVLEQGAPVFHLHALDLTSGQERLNGPVVIGATVAGTGSEALPNGTVPFDPMQHIQRPALLLANGAVYVAFGSHGDEPPYHGWLMSYDASEVTRQLGVFMTTPNGNAGSIWQGGRGPAADSQGNIYVITANGDYDGATNFGQSFLKLAGATPLRVDSFTAANWEVLSDGDFDISAGPALAGGAQTVVGADKLGELYVVNAGGMSQPGGGTLSQVSGGSIFNLAVWNRSSDAYVYVQGENEPVKCFQLTGQSLNPNPVSEGANPTPYSRIGMTLSANGAQDGSAILWETGGDYFDEYAPGALHAFDASNLVGELWNSDMNGDRDTMPQVAKFANPTVVNGKVYVPTNGYAVAVYGLLTPAAGSPGQPAIAAVANAASYSMNAVSPGELVAIFGSNLGPAVPALTQLTANGLVANSLGGTQALFNGVPGPVLYASSNQVNAIAPFGLSSSVVEVQVAYNGQESAWSEIVVTPSTPGIFSADGSGAGQAIALNQDDSVNSLANPAAIGSVITLWATGAGQSSPAGQDGAVVAIYNLPAPILPVTAQVGGQPASVMYAGGGPGIVEGVIQVDLLLPGGLPVGTAVPVALWIGGISSQSGLTVALGP